MQSSACKPCVAAEEEQLSPQSQVSPMGRLHGADMSASWMRPYFEAKKAHNSAAVSGRRRWLSEDTTVALDHEKESVLIVIVLYNA